VQKLILGQTLTTDAGGELERSERDKNTTAAGLKLTSEYWSRVYDYEPEDIDEAAMNAPPPPMLAVPPPDGSTGNNPPPNKKFSVLFGPQRFTPEQQAVERGVAEVLASIDSIIASAEIQAAIRIATSPEDLAQRLAALMPSADPTEFQTVLSRSLFAADIMGYAHAQRGD
jgi:hypothetical protein